MNQARNRLNSHQALLEWANIKQIHYRKSSPSLTQSRAIAIQCARRNLGQLCRARWLTQEPLYRPKPASFLEGKIKNISSSTSPNAAVKLLSATVQISSQRSNRTNIEGETRRLSLETRRPCPPFRRRLARRIPISQVHALSVITWHWARKVKAMDRSVTQMIWLICSTRNSTHPIWSNQIWDWTTQIGSPLSSIHMRDLSKCNRKPTGTVYSSRALTQATYLPKLKPELRWDRTYTRSPKRWLFLKPQDSKNRRKSKRLTPNSIKITVTYLRTPTSARVVWLITRNLRISTITPLRRPKANRVVWFKMMMSSRLWNGLTSLIMMTRNLALQRLNPMSRERTLNNWRRWPRLWQGWRLFWRSISTLRHRFRPNALHKSRRSCAWKHFLPRTTSQIHKVQM